MRANVMLYDYENTETFNVSISHSTYAIIIFHGRECKC